MAKRSPSTDTNKVARLLKSLADARTTIPQALPASLEGQTRPEGESIFTMASRAATEAHIDRVAQVTGGPLDVEFFISIYEHTRNPLWLWMGLAVTGSPGELQPEIFRYLKQSADKFFKGVLDQVQSLERVRITPGQDYQDGFTSLGREQVPSPDIAAVLGLLYPGRNLFQAAAKDFQAISMAVASADLIHRTGCTQEQVHTLLAIVLGRGSSEKGPSTEGVRRIVTHGKKLLRKRRGKATG